MYYFVPTHDCITSEYVLCYHTYIYDQGNMLLLSLKNLTILYYRGDHANTQLYWMMDRKFAILHCDPSWAFQPIAEAHIIYVYMILLFDWLHYWGSRLLLYALKAWKGKTRIQISLYMYQHIYIKVKNIAINQSWITSHTLNTTGTCTCTLHVHIKSWMKQ